MGQRAGALSTQVLQEFSAVATRKLGLPPARARRIVAEYAVWSVVETTPQLIVSASLLQEEHGVAFWDALIVEAALLAGATELLSEDLQVSPVRGPHRPEPVRRVVSAQPCSRWLV